MGSAIFIDFQWLQIALLIYHESIKSKNNVVISLCIFCSLNTLNQT